MRSLKRLSAIALSCVWLIEVAKAIPLDSLQPRKEVDANIECAFALPNPQPWPANVPPRSSYHSLTDLCAKNQNLANVGCLCDSPWDRVECRPDLGDHILRHRFVEVCLDHCFCRNQKINRLPPPAAGSLPLPPGAPLRQLPQEPYQGPNPFAGTSNLRLPGSSYRPFAVPPQ